MTTGVGTSSHAVHAVYSCDYLTFLVDGPDLSFLGTGQSRHLLVAWGPPYSLVRCACGDVVELGSYPGGLSVGRRLCWSVPGIFYNVFQDTGAMLKFSGEFQKPRAVGIYCMYVKMLFQIENHFETFCVHMCTKI